MNHDRGYRSTLEIVFFMFRRGGPECIAHGRKKKKNYRTISSSRKHHYLPTAAIPSDSGVGGVGGGSRVSAQCCQRVQKFKPTSLARTDVVEWYAPRVAGKRYRCTREERLWRAYCWVAAAAAAAVTAVTAAVNAAAATGHADVAALLWFACNWPLKTTALSPSRRESCIVVVPMTSTIAPKNYWTAILTSVNILQRPLGDRGEGRSVARRLQK